MGSKRKKSEPDFLHLLMDFMFEQPWWVGGVMAGVVFFLLFLSLPNIPLVACAFTGLVLVMWMITLMARTSQGKRLDTQTGVESIQALSWRHFELLLAEAYRREGYVVKIGDGDAPDGGVDLRLRRGNETVLVQCKHWKRQKVGVNIVRELLGVVTHQGATSGIVVTSGNYTQDAIDFAGKSCVTLVDGTKLWTLISAVKKGQIPSPVSELPAQVTEDTPADQSADYAPVCPRCGSSMVLRTAKRGAKAGADFWGCSTYPKCRGIVNIVASCPTS